MWEVSGGSGVHEGHSVTPPGICLHFQGRLKT